MEPRKRSRITFSEVKWESDGFLRKVKSHNEKTYCMYCTHTVMYTHKQPSITITRIHLLIYSSTHSFVRSFLVFSEGDKFSFPSFN